MRTIQAIVVPSLLSLVVGWSMLCASSVSASTVSPLPASDYTVRSVCSAPAPGHVSCLALELLPRTAAARARTHPLAITAVLRLVGFPAPE
jgi:hypothetical protein